jgi:type I restriction enzyme S subunit
MPKAPTLGSASVDQWDNEAVPEGWSLRSIADLFEEGSLYIKNGFPQGAHNQIGNGVPHLRPFNISGDGCIDLSEIKYVQAPGKESPYWVQPGDVIFNNTNSEALVGKTAHFEHAGRFVLSNHMTILRVTGASLDYYWLSKVLLSFWHQGLFQSLCRRHVNQASVGIERLKGVTLAVPPIREQRAIAHVLRTVQRAKEATEKVITATRQLKASLMRHLFTYGPVPVGQGDKVALKEAEVGAIPDVWSLEPLSDCTDIVYGAQAAVAHNTDPRIGTPILTNINITNEGTIDLSTLRYYRIPEAKRDKLILQKGDLLFNWRSGSQDHVGKTALFDLDGEYTFSSFILRFRPHGAVDSRYLYHYFCWLKGCGYFSHYKDQSSVNSVFNASAASRVPVALPACGEQRSIVALMSGAEHKLSSELERKNALDALFESLLDGLMTGKLRVKDLDLQTQEAE